MVIYYCVFLCDTEYYSHSDRYEKLPLWAKHNDLLTNTYHTFISQVIRSMWGLFISWCDHTGLSAITQTMQQDCVYVGGGSDVFSVHSWILYLFKVVN